MAKQGWIKLYRSILEDEIWLDDEPYDFRSAWVELILIANHENSNIFNKRPISRGQHWTSIRKLAERWHWRKSKVKSFLDKLQLTGMVSVDYTNTGLMITICNYNKYQKVGTTGTTSVTTLGTTSVTTLGTTSVTTLGTQTRMIENDIKNDKEIEAPPSSQWSGLE